MIEGLCSGDGLGVKLIVVNCRLLAHFEICQWVRVKFLCVQVALFFLVAIERVRAFAAFKIIKLKFIEGFEFCLFSYRVGSKSSRWLSAPYSFPN